MLVAGPHSCLINQCLFLYAAYNITEICIAVIFCVLNKVVLCPSLCESLAKDSESFIKTPTFFLKSFKASDSLIVHTTHYQPLV